VEIERAAFFEGHLYLDSWEGWRDASTGDGFDKCSPHIGTEKWGGNVRVTDVE
jgi:hypothetical protein